MNPWRQRVVTLTVLFFCALGVAGTPLIWLVQFLNRFSGFDMPFSAREIQVSAPGYATTNFVVSATNVSVDYIQTGQLLLTPVGPIPNH